jgi:hypothetical protein
MSDGASHCLNCGAALGGPFCQACGQKAASVHLGFGHVLHEVIHEFLHLDGKIFTTLKVLVTQPGQLTKDLVEGHRARFVTPLRLYLTFSILFFFLFTVLPGGGASGFNVTFSNESSTGWTVNAGPRTDADSAPDDPVKRSEITGRFNSSFPRAVFMVMPVSALLTLAFYRRRQPFYVAHLYYAVHVHAFAFLVGSVVVLLSRGVRFAEVVAVPAFLSVFLYHFLALHRFFGESWPRTLWKGTLITTMYLVLVAVAMGLLLWFAVTGFEGG